MALSQIRSRGVLKVGTTGDYMPMSFRDPASGDYIGMDADLARALAGSLDVDIEFVATSWPSLEDDTLAGRFDLALCGITITEDRKTRILMSDGYMESGKTILCRSEDAHRFTGLDSVNRPDVRVMVNPGGLNQQFARENLPDAVLTVHDSNQEIPALVACGKADVMITEVQEAGYYAGLDRRLAAPLADRPFTHARMGIMMPKGSEDLLAYVNSFLREYEREKKAPLTGRNL